MRRLLKTAGIGIVGFVTPRFLVGIGIPLDTWAVNAGRAAHAAMTAQWSLTVLGLLLGIPLMLSELIWDPIGRVLGSATFGRLSVSEAALRIYEQTQERDLWIAAVAEAFGEGDVRSQIMAYICTRAPELRFFGRREPSRRWQEIPAVAVRHFKFRNNANDLVGTHSGDPGYTDLQMRKSDFKRAMKLAKEWR